MCMSCDRGLVTLQFVKAGAAWGCVRGPHLMGKEPDLAAPEMKLRKANTHTHTHARTHHRVALGSRAFSHSSQPRVGHVGTALRI